MHEDFRCWSRMKVLLGVKIKLVLNILTRIRNCEVLKPIERILPKLQPNEVLAEVVF